ncbi:MAG: hypothetical protein HYY49_05310 [Ignavibacteriales bacterium]|nr:hypothetical protein [Ignavibacteriales bacterium]
MQVLMILCLQVGLQAPTGFADKLMKERDYFRAITEYKRAMFEARKDSITIYCLSQIARAYQKSAKSELAIEYAAELLMRPDASAMYRQRANITIGLCYLQDKMPQLALPYLKTAHEENDTVQFALLCLGLAYVGLQQFEEAAGYFDKTAEREKDPAFKLKMMDFAASTRSMLQRSQKSPLLAASLSAAVPGAGQLYSDHPYDAFQAFVYTASMAFGTYSMYKYEHELKGQLVWTYVGISITGVFHLANIIGAYRTAEYRNWRQLSDFSNELFEFVITQGEF